MLRHIAMLTLTAETADDTRAEIVEALRALPGKIAEIRGYEVGVDLSLLPGNASIAVVAEFDSADDWAVYRSHPDHVAVLEGLIIPNLEHRTGLQYERPA